MAVVLITTAPSREAYEAVSAEVGEAPPQGCIVHTATEVDGGVRIVDVWESQQAIDDFFASRLGPAFEKLGVPPTQPELTEPFHVQTQG
jgi:quinol monooxygenase YgiN